MLESRKKRGSIIHIEENPLENGNVDGITFKIENLNNTRLIKSEELNELIIRINATT